MLRLSEGERATALRDYIRRKQRRVPDEMGHFAKRRRQHAVSDLASEGFLPGDGSVCELVVGGVPAARACIALRLLALPFAVGAVPVPLAAAQPLKVDVRRSEHSL